MKSFNNILFIPLYCLLLMVGCTTPTAGDTAPKTEGPKLAADCYDASKDNPEAPCTMEYAPVCGCDGKTYSNDCVAQTSGILKWTSGTCE